MSQPRLSIHLSAFNPEIAIPCWDIRDRVFSQEQQIDPELDIDGLDEQSWMILAMVDDLPAGTGRMLTDGHIGRLAVLADYRGMGIGSAIVEAFTELAQQQGYKRLYLSAQVRAADFYLSLGYQPCAEPHMEAGIPHQMMEKLL